MLTIGIEAERANAPQKTGVEHYAKQLILHLAQIDLENTYILYLRTQPEEWFLNLPANFKVKVMPFPLFWTQIRLSFEMLLHKVDVLMIPASALPLIHPKNSVVTVHDLAWKFYPETFTGFMRWFLNWSTGFAARNAKTVIAVSEATKKDLVKFYNIEEKKVVVVHHGYEKTVHSKQYTVESAKWKVQSHSQISNQKINKSANQLISQSINQLIPSRFVLFLSTLQPRKNLEGLIDAFVELKKELPELSHKLVVVGKPGWKFEGIFKKIEENKDLVVYLNHLEEEKAFVLSKAEVLVLPSFYEGFGMTILEAFEAGVPVATANISSMPEVAKDAAVYFDPHKVVEIKNAIKQILLDKSLQESLIAKGRERLKVFSWEKAAKETLEVFKRE